MLNSHSLDDEPLRIARAFILRGEQVPIRVEAVLEGRGIDVPALRARLIAMNRGH